MSKKIRTIPKIGGSHPSGVHFAPDALNALKLVLKTQSQLNGKDFYSLKPIFNSSSVKGVRFRHHKPLPRAPCLFIKPYPPTDMKVEQILPSFEEAGFIIADITPESVGIKFYGWRYGRDSLSVIEDLEPHHTITIQSDNS